MRVAGYRVECGASESLEQRVEGRTHGSRGCCDILVCLTLKIVVHRLGGAPQAVLGNIGRLWYGCGFSIKGSGARCLVPRVVMFRGDGTLNGCCPWRERREGVAEGPWIIPAVEACCKKDPASSPLSLSVLVTKCSLWSLLLQ